MKRNQGFVSALRGGEKDFAERNPVQSARGFVSGYKSNIKFSQMMGWNTEEDEAKLKIARKKLREVKASGVKDLDYDEKGSLRK